MFILCINSDVKNIFLELWLVFVLIEWTVFSVSLGNSADAGLVL